jgi:hypothetical protein
MAYRRVIPGQHVALKLVEEGHVRAFLSARVSADPQMRSAAQGQPGS